MLRTDRTRSIECSFRCLDHYHTNKYQQPYGNHNVWPIDKYYKIARWAFFSCFFLVFFLIFFPVLGNAFFSGKIQLLTKKYLIKKILSDPQGAKYNSFLFLLKSLSWSSLKWVYFYDSSIAFNILCYVHKRITLPTKAFSGLFSFHPALAKGFLSSPWNIIEDGLYVESSANGMTNCAAVVPNSWKMHYSFFDSGNGGSFHSPLSYVSISKRRATNLQISPSWFLNVQPIWASGLCHVELC